MRFFSSFRRRLSFSYFSVKAKASIKRSFAIFRNTGSGPIPYILRRIEASKQTRLNAGDPAAIEKLVLALAGKVRNAKNAVLSSLRLLFTTPKGRIKGILSLCSVCAVAAISAYVFSSPLFDFSLSVKVNGQDVGTVSRMGIVEDLILEAEKHIADYSGSPYNVHATVSYSVVKADSSHPLDAEKVRSMIFTSADHLGEAKYYELFIDGQSMGLHTGRNTLEMLFSRLALELAPEEYKDYKLGFAEDISIVPVKADDSRLLDIAQLEELLRSEKKGAEYYTVKSGDSVSRICSKFDLSRAELKQLNPDKNLDGIIHIGDVFMVSDRVPYLTVTVTHRQEYSEEVPFETIIEYDEELYVNQSSITREGECGKARVVADVECDLKGNVIRRSVHEYTVTQEPVARITLAGSKPLPPKVATGTFIQPTTGYLSSKVGYRPNLGDTHTGIDIANSVGTVIWASDGGTVIHAGWKGNYGKCVIIDHGNGYTTYYAHNDEILVTVGQKVAPHENISLMGATGRVTGPHLHFEIRYNGKWQNPLNYFKFKY